MWWMTWDCFLCFFVGHAEKVGVWKKVRYSAALQEVTVLKKHMFKKYGSEKYRFAMNFSLHGNRQAKIPLVGWGPKLKHRNCKWSPDT